MLETKTPLFCTACRKLVAVERPATGPAACPDCGAEVELPDAQDVFVSFSSTDLEKAQEVAAALRAAGITFWVAPDRIGLGEWFVTAIVEALARARVVVLLLSSNAVKSSWVEREISEAVSRRLPILPLKIEEFEVPREFSWLLKHNQWEDAYRDAFEVHLPRLVARVQEELRRAAARELQQADDDGMPASVAQPVNASLAGVNPDVSPYVGPQPFSALMADRFFGRQHEAETLLRLLARGRVALVYAPSGAGKSSLLNTVVTQSLEAEGYDVLLGARVGGALPRTIKAADLRNVFVFSVIFGLDASNTRNPKARLVDWLDSIRRKPGTRGRVVVFDQFEELFTQHPERYEDRQEFFDDLAEALGSDPQLRIVLAMRQEYLADIEPLLARLPSSAQLQRFALRRMEFAGALEAITQPAARYATFAPRVAEEIVEQLNTIHVPGFDGVMVTKPGEFIEMVHLQIVCERLWGSLPRGVTRIEREHVERAAGEGKTFNEFVVNALNAFYDDTIERVVHSETTRKHGGFSPELLRLGCMKFITPAATRTMVQRSHGRTGRLPDWIVEQLENCHLLRAEQRGGHRWYELSHDRLAEPVGRQLDRKVSSLLYAADLLDKVLEKVLAERGQRLNGYFAEHDEILAECRPFQEQAGLFEDESEFVLRASLYSGRDTAAWCRRVGADFPEVRTAVLRDAMHAEAPMVRRNLATLLGIEHLPGLLPELVELALADPDDGVRRLAATSLAQIDQAAAYDALAAAFRDPARHARTREALARIRIVTDARVVAPVFESRFRELDGAARSGVRHLAWAVRAREGFPTFPFVVAPAAGIAALTAAAFKWLPGMLDWAVVQSSPSAAMGIFHGITAGIIWAGTITFALTIYHVIVGRDLARRSILRPFGALVAGALGGISSSLLVVAVIATVYDPKSLESMGWLQSASHSSGAVFWHDLFVATRFGWVHLITGTGLGVGMALTTNSLRASGRWEEFLQRQTAVTGLRQVRRLLKDITGIAARHVWPLPLAVGIAAVCAYLVPHTLPPEDSWKASAEGLIKGLIGDCATQVIGAFFAIVGMGLGIVVLRFGFHVEARRN